MRLYTLAFALFFAAMPAFTANTFEDTDRAAQKVLSSGDTKAAIALYEEYLQSHPKHVKTLCLLATCYGFEGNAPQQEAISRKAITLDPKSPDALMNLGNALSTQKKWDEAEGLYLTAYAIAKDRREAASMRNIACALSNLYIARPNHDDREAIRWADLCLSRISKSVMDGDGAFIGLRADAPMEAMLELATYTAAIHNKAGAHGNLGETQKAREVLEVHIARYPNDARAVDLLKRYP